jgi:Tol biopolymer transport system component
LSDERTIVHRALRDGQACVVSTVDTSSGAVTELYRTRDLLLEAPNWTSPGALILNGDGVLWRLDCDVGDLTRLVIPGLPDLNNDHVPAPDGDTMFVSGYDGHIYRVALSTGEHHQVTSDDPDRPMNHFLHGVSPDGHEIAFVGVEPGANGPWGPANIFTMPSDGGPVHQVTFGDRPADGPEYSPDGAWLYFNTEAFADTEGHAQIARIRRDGTGLERLTFDERVNWFPHLAPVGDLACYLSYPPGTTGHPENEPVRLELVQGDDWSSASTIVELLGGQGTINVNSWSPDGRSFAFVAYPLDG